MHPHYPQPHQQKSRRPLQSQGFNPPAQTSWPSPQVPYQQTVQPQAPGPGFVQSYQSYPQYQQQRSAQYYQQPQQFAPLQQQRYASQPRAAPHATNVHNPTYYSPAPAQVPSSQVHSSYAPSPSYSQPSVVPPARANSRSPEKRPLPAPAASAGSSPSSMMSQAPVGGYVTPPRSHGTPYASQGTHTNPPVSSFSSFPAPQSFSHGQSFQVQTHFPSQSQPHPQTHHTPPPHTRTTLPHLSRSHIDGTSPTTPTRTPESPPKRPLPALPGGAASSSPVASSRPGVPESSHAVSPAQRRTLPYSPPFPLSADSGQSVGRGAIRPPQRSSTLPNPILPQEHINGVLPTASKDDAEQVSVPRQATSHVHTEASTSYSRSGGFALSSSAQRATPSAFALPPRQKPRQSLAFRIASLSLQEEQSQQRSINHTTPLTSQASDPSSRNDTLPSSLQFTTQTRTDLDDAPPASSILRSSFESKSVSHTPPRPHPPFSVPSINVPGNEKESSRVSISVSESPPMSVSRLPSINIFESPATPVSKPPLINVTEVPTIDAPAAFSDDEMDGPSITVSEATPKIAVSEFPETLDLSQSSGIPDIIVADLEGTLDTSLSAPAQKRKGLICCGCGNGIIGRIVSAMGGRWHPACFKCTVCSELLEHVSSYEHAWKPYCHLDYHEKFAPQCYHCRTPIIDERFITLDDPALGKRVYHEQHFFCAECGDPFLAPTIKKTDTDNPGVVAQDDDVGFTVYKGHPYCEACHVRLRYPKCKRCKRSIRDGVQAVEALGGKWCWECFLCAGCEKPFDSPAFFQRENKPYCEACFNIIIKSEL